jgi:hypothetical protein
MSFPMRFFEWRQLTVKSLWHLFVGTKSVCGRETSNGEFQFAKEKPPADSKICKLCIQNASKIKERIDNIL